MKALSKKIPLFILIFNLLCISCLAPRGKAAYAAETSPASYDETDVLADLEGSTLNGKPFDKDDYAQNDVRDPQIITLVEYGYNFYAARQDNYGLYIYLYNPHAVAINDDTRNQILLQAGDNAANKYELQILDYSDDPGYEGIFYKCKLALTDVERATILASVKRASRVYKVTELELSLNDQVSMYPCTTTYTFTGFAKGYGSELAADESTLACSVDGFEEYVELDVHQTVYRPKGDLSIQSEEDEGIFSQGQLKDGNQPQLNSCYFRIPRKYITQYGALTRTVCEWDEYVTKPILVTTDLQDWRALQSIQGSPTTEYYPNKDYGVMIMSFGNQFYTNDHLFTPDWHVTPFMWTSNLDLNEFDENNYYVYYWDDAYGLRWPGGDMSVEDWHKERFENLAAIFYKSGVSYWNASISADELQQQLLDNSARLGGPYFGGANGNYSQALFTDYVDAGRKRGHQTVEIELKKENNLVWSNAVVEKHFWGIGNELLEVPESFNYQQGITIQAADLEGDDATIAEKLYIGKSDVADLKAEFAKAQLHDEDLVLLRYASTNYHSGKAIVKVKELIGEIPGAAGGIIQGQRDDTLMHEWMDDYHYGKIDGYLAQQTVFLNFDIISMWFETDDAATEIPVMMRPMDVLSNIQPGIAEQPDSVGSSKMPWYIWLAIILIIVVVLIVLATIFPVLKPIFLAVAKGLAWIILAPFRLIAWIISKISEASEKRRNKKRSSNSKTAAPKQKQRTDAPAKQTQKAPASVKQQTPVAAKKKPTQKKAPTSKKKKAVKNGK